MIQSFVQRLLFPFSGGSKVRNGNFYLVWWPPSASDVLGVFCMIDCDSHLWPHFRQRLLPKPNQLCRRKKRGCSIFGAFETWSDKYRVSIMSCIKYFIIINHSVHWWKRSVLYDEMIFHQRLVYLWCSQANIRPWLGLFKLQMFRDRHKNQPLYTVLLNRGNSLAIIQRMKGNLTQIKITSSWHLPCRDREAQNCRVQISCKGWICTLYQTDYSLN